MSIDFEYISAQTYEDLIGGKFCTNCHHLISDHFEFDCTKEARCYFSESKDGTFVGCDCKKIGKDFRFTFNPEELVVLNAA